MTYEEIVAKTKELAQNFMSEDYSGHLAVEVQITGEGEGVFYIEVKDGAMNVEPYDYHDRDCRLISAADNFFKICMGKLDPVFAYTTGKLKVDGDVGKALEFSKISDKMAKRAKKKK